MGCRAHAIVGAGNYLRLRQGISSADCALQFANQDLKKRSLVIRLLCQEQPITKEEPMVQRHSSTPEQQLQWSTEMIAHAGEYGLVSRLARESGLSRPTLYALKARAIQALRQTF